MATEELKQDPSFHALLEVDFDPKAFASSTIQQHMVGETLLKLTNGISELDKELYSQVVTNYEDLLSQATGIEALESVLKMMQTRIDSLRGAVDRISSKIVDPYQVIVSRSSQLANLQETCDLLRSVIRLLYLVRRLKSQMQGGSREITKVAQTFSEIDQLTQGGALSGIQVLEEERPWLNRARREVESQAKKMLLNGLELMNPTQVGVSLQVFYNLDQLAPTLLSVLGGYRQAAQHDIQNTLDPATLIQGTEGGGPGRSTLPLLGSSASWKAALWTRLDRLVNNIHKTHSQVHQLYVVLRKKKDPVSHTSYLDAIAQSEAHRLLSHFWEAIAEDLAVELQAAAHASTFLRQTFESDYPKLVRAFSELLSRLEQFSQGEGKPPSAYLVSPLATRAQDRDTKSSSQEEALLKALSPFEKSYISRSLTRLLESVNQLFLPASKALPKEENLQGIIRTINTELSSAGGSNALASLVGKNVEKAVRLFTMQCEEMVLSGREVVQVSGPPNPAQLQNLSLANTLHAFTRTVRQQVLSSSSLPSAARNIISAAVEQSEAQMVAIVTPFMQEIRRVLEQMIASMHTESFAGEVKPGMILGTPDAPCSGYMREMQSFTVRIHSQHLAKFNCTDEIHKQLQLLTVRLLELFVRHVCLIRPLGEAGKMRITTDMAQIELALAPFCSRISELGLPYKTLRTLRRVLFLATDNLLTESTVGIGTSLAYSNTLNYLFSRAPNDMKAPHQVQGWSEVEYSDWMDKHPLEKERLAFIQATLETHGNRIRGQSHAHLSPVHHVMLELLKQALATHGSM